MDRELTDREKELLADFKWDDVSESENPHPYFEMAEDINNCSEKIADYVIESLSLDQWHGEEFIEITVPVSVHPLLEDRFNLEYTDDSRFIVFDLIRARFRLSFDSIAYLLNERLNELLPEKNSELEAFFKQEMKRIDENDNKEYRTGAATKVKVKSIDLYDEPMMDVIVKEKLCGAGEEKEVSTKAKQEGKSISAEITFETYRNWE